jgi:hypothetical protein
MRFVDAHDKRVDYSSTQGADAKFGIETCPYARSRFEQLLGCSIVLASEDLGLMLLTLLSEVNPVR